ncbi:MAG TPA: DUF998 domain-containing protein [Cytophagaceae bacterium]|jgi:hypothetical membrane protein
MTFLIRQAKLIPLLFFIPVFFSGFLVDGYDSIRQHASEVALSNFIVAKLISNAGAILTGLSCIFLSIGILNTRKYYICSVLFMIFGVSMISNGIYPMGTPMH